MIILWGYWKGKGNWVIGTVQCTEESYSRMSEQVEDIYLQTPNSWVRVRLLGWILVIVRCVVVVAWVRCEIFVCGGEVGQVCP